MHIDENGKFWWVAADLGKALDITNIHTSLVNFPEDEIHVRSTYTNRGPREAVMVNEPGMYRLIFQSRKPEAEAMKRWVYHEVLPSLRQFGSYSVNAGADKGVNSIDTPAPEPMPLTPSGYLPAPKPPRRENAEISIHLIKVWVFIRDSGDWVSNREIAARTGVKLRTVSNHTKYLVDLGLVSVHEMFPRHLFEVSPVADKRNFGVYNRLNEIADRVGNRLAIRTI